MKVVTVPQLKYLLQKIVIKVQINCDKCRTKAMKSAATVEGVEFLAMEGRERDHVVVIGDGIDCIRLTCILRRKLGHAELVSVEEVKKNSEDKPVNKEKEKGTVVNVDQPAMQWNPSYPPISKVTYIMEEMNDPGSNICSIM